MHTKGRKEGPNAFRKVEVMGLGEGHGYMSKGS